MPGTRRVHHHASPSRSLRSLLRDLLLIALAAISWGTTGPVTATLAARAGAHPLLVGMARMWTAAVLLAAGTRLAGHPLVLARADLPRCLALGAAMAAFQATYFTAVTTIGVAVAALVAICSAPLMIAGLAAGLLGERLTRRLLLSLGLGILGTALLVIGPRTTGDFTLRFVLGSGLALGAGLSYALYVVVAKASLARSAPLPLATGTFLVAAVLLTPFGASTPGAWHQVVAGWPGLLYLGGVATAAAYALYTLGLRRVPASVAAVLALLEPLTAAGLGVLLFGERLGGAGVVGTALLGAAMALLILDRRA